MRFTESNRERAQRILKRLRKEFPQFQIQKIKGKDAVYVTLPPKKVEVPQPLNNSIQPVHLETIVNLAQRMATAMVRETVDSVVKSVVTALSKDLIDQLKDKLPQQQVIIEKSVSDIARKTRESFSTDKIVVPIKFDNGLELIGSGSKEVQADAGDFDAILDQLPS